MVKYYALVFLSVILILGWISGLLGEKQPYREKRATDTNIHAYDDERTSIKEILLTVYYFVPSNKLDDAADTSWKEPMIQTLEDLKRFHDMQFEGQSHLSFVIHPTSIVGKQSNIFYDSTDTTRGNPHAIVSIAEELKDMEITTNAGPDVYHVTYIVYDGVGASGMNHAALINRRFLTDSAYEQVRESLIAHEFYHSLGIPDGYDISTGTSTTSDLMGHGRTTRDLKSNFLENSTLAHFGL